LGSLTYTYAVAPTHVNLSTEGLRDWAHWGLYDQNSFNHKAGVPSQIGNYTAIGSDPVWNYTDNWTLYSWNSGTPVASVTDTPTGVYITGRNNGFEVRAAADTTIKTLKLYVGAWQAHGLLRAYMSDFSTPIDIDSSLDNTVNALGAVYTLRYQAGAPGQSLIARYTVLSTHDSYGNVTLQAATLVSDNNPPSVTWLSPTNDSVFLAPTNITLEADAFDSDGSVTRVEFFNEATKLGEATTAPYRFTWTNVLAGTYSLSARAVWSPTAQTFVPPSDRVSPARFGKKYSTAVRLVNATWV